MTRKAPAKREERTKKSREELRALRIQNLTRAGMGRPKGSKNKTPALLKDMIRNALDAAGGEDYLAAVAVAEPAAFTALVGKLIPKDLNVDTKGKLVIEHKVTGVD